MAAALRKSGVPVPSRIVPAQPVARQHEPAIKDDNRPARGSRPASIIPNARAAVFEQLERLFVPAYGFNDVAQAEAHVGRVGLTIDEKPRTIARTLRGDKVYIEHGRAFGSPESDIDLRPFSDRSGTIDPRYRQPWLTLRKADAERPDGAYNVLLLVEGRRTASYFGERKRAAPWVSRARTGPWEMAVAWERGDGAELYPVEEDGGRIQPTRIFAARSAHGVIIARRALIGTNGIVTGFLTEIWFVTLEILDRNASQDDAVRPVFNIKRYNETENVDPLSYRKDIDPNALALFNRAAEIFRCECEHGMPADVRRQLDLFVRQSSLTSLPGGRDFASKVYTSEFGDYMAALDMAQEPWQLAIVVAQYGYSSEFAEFPQYFSRGETTREMIRRYVAARPAARGAWIEKTMEEYVYQTTDTWNYMGD